MEERPTLVLRAEEELGITAGLQDRVIQVYGGVVYMDFAKEFIQQHGHGRYRGCTAIMIMIYVHILATRMHSLRAQLPGALEMGTPKLAPRLN